MKRYRVALAALLLSACGADDPHQPAPPGDEVADDQAAASGDAAHDAGQDGGLDTRPVGAGSFADAGRRNGGAATIDGGAHASDAASEPDARPGRAPRPDRPRNDAAPAPDSASSDAGGACPASGSVRYSLVRVAAPSAEQSAAYERIARAMDTAIAKYNCYTNLSRSLRVEYVPSVATADGNTNGNIRFGAQASMNFVTAMHEIGHTFGVGGSEFKSRVRDGRFDGPVATAEIRRLSGKADELVHSDGTHFWPYGLNYEREYERESDAEAHCQMVVAIRTDLGL